MVNKVILIGNLGRDPEVRSTPAGLAVATISLATTHRTKDSQSGEWTEKTEWHRVVAFGRQAEVAGQYLNKGRQIYVEGRLQTSSWDDKQSGEKRYKTEVICENFKMLGKRDASTGSGYSDASAGSGYGDASAGSGYGGGTSAPSEVAEPSGGGPDDDIPF